MTTLLIIFAKEPRPGQVKTRLSPPLSPEEAAQLYHSFLQDILEEMARVPGVRLAVAFSPLEAQVFFRGLAPPGTDLFPQEGADLGERMAQAFARGFAAGFGPVLLRGGDVPDLPAAVVSEAAEVLAAGRDQVVLGPAPTAVTTWWACPSLSPACSRDRPGPAARSSRTPCAWPGSWASGSTSCPPGPTSTRMTTCGPSSTGPARGRSRGGAAMNRPGNCLPGWRPTNPGMATRLDSLVLLV